MRNEKEIGNWGDLPALPDGFWGDNHALNIPPRNNGKKSDTMPNRTRDFVTQKFELYPREERAIRANAKPKRRNNFVEIIQWIAAIAILVALLVAGGARAQSIPCPAPTSTLSSVNYNPLSTTDTIAPFAMTIQPSNYSGRGSNPTRELNIVKESIGQETDGPSGAHLVSYDFLHFGGTLSRLGGFADNLSLLGSPWRGAGFKSRLYAYGYPSYNASATNNYSVRIPKSQSIASGSYTIQYYTFGYWEELINNPNSTCPFAGKTINGAIRTFTLNVPSTMAISMAGGGVAGTINFDNQGGLANNAKRAASIRLRSNTPYKVTMDSAHNGVLKLNNLQTATEQISYSATFANAPISETTAYTNSNPTGTGGADIDVPFEVTIGDTSNARAGFYKDVVTLTIAPPI